MMKLNNVNMSYRMTLRSLLGCLFVFSIAACEGGDEPVRPGVTVTPGGAETGGMSPVDPAGEDPAGEDPAGEDPGGEGPAGDTAGDDPAGTPMGGAPAGDQPPPCEIQELGPDEAVFADPVGPSLILSCGNSFCHGPGSGTGFALSVDAAEFTPPLDGALLTESLEAAMSYVVPGEPNASVLLSKAYNGHVSVGITFERDSAEYAQLSDWIEAMVECVPVDPPPPPAGMEVGGDPMGGMEMMGGMEPAGTPGGGDTTVLCDLLPNGDPQNRADGLYYEQFANEINGSLSQSCGSSGCHGTPMNGFWLQSSNDPCAVPANFLMIQAYINFANPDESLVLTAPYDPDHEGSDIYTGRSDQRFIDLRNWILLAFE